MIRGSSSASRETDSQLRIARGYRAQRSYSVANTPGGGVIELTVEHLPGGVVPLMAMLRTARRVPPGHVKVERFGSSG